MEDADAVICAARTSKNKNPGDGISLFLVPASLPGITVKPALMVSGEKAYLVTMDNVRIGGDALLGKLDEGWPVLEKVLARANVADCAIMVGLAQKAMELTLDYARERIAFGHPIGAFQSIQHRCADMLVAVDGSRFITWQAAWKIAGNQADDKDASVAKAWVSRACKNVMHSAHQIHGAIAFTEDHILHFYIKMARAREFSHGGADRHLESIVNASVREK